MNNPYLMALQWQMACMQSWVSAMHKSAEMWSHMVDMEARLTHEPAEAQKRWHAVIPNGAWLLDHYGKRTRDVDPERI